MAAEQRTVSGDGDPSFRVLGPLGASRDGVELALGGRQQRLVLALLLDADGSTVRTDTLIDRVWEADPPATARKALQGYVHHLRTVLGGVIETNAGGYAIPGPRLDSRRFRRLRDEARQLLYVDPAAAIDLLDEGLSLWHGPAFADLRGHARIEDAARALDRERVQALGDRVDAALALGRHTAIVAELESLSAEYPFDERFRRQLMLAQYRCGRQVEALRGLERHRRLLVDELGLDVAPELRALEERILRQDPDLAPDAVTGDGTGSVRGFELREHIDVHGPVERFRAYQRSVGRDVLLTAYGPSVADDPAFVAGYERTARAIAALSHPNVVPVLDTWREPGRAYQVTPWLPGGTLQGRLEGDERPSTAWRLRTLRDVALALDAAGRAGVHHGDLGAESVWLDGHGRALLGGFSLVEADGAGGDSTRDQADFATLAADVLVGSDPSLAAAVEEVVADRGLAPVQLVRLLENRAGLGPAPAQPPVAGTQRNPYKGLRAFSETEAEDFHGREALVARLVDATERHRLVAVVGPSGSGKSSVVRAGLLPVLREAHGPGRLLVAETFPGSHPFEELATALTRIAVDRAPLDRLGEDDRGLLRAVKRILPDEDCRVLLLIDQFEELWTMGASGDERSRFVAALVTAATEPRSPLRIVITLRADFFDRPLDHPGLGRVVRDGLVPVSLPEPDELARAIAGPARAEGVEFADGLVTQIVEDVGPHSGALPLLQHALTELFESRSSDVISLADYRTAGGVLGAVGRRAEALYRDLTPAAQDALRQVLLRLVSIEKETDDLRRRVRRSELIGLVHDPAALDDALSSFAQHRLLVFDRDETSRGATVEIAHEALLREWPRLARWIADHRHDLQLRRRLWPSVEEWVAAGEDPAYLARGARLRELDAWAASTSLALSPTEHLFLQASIEGERARESAVARRRRRTMAGLVALSAVFAVVAGLAVVQRQTATEVARDAETARLAATAAALAEDEPRVALLLAAAAHERASTPATLGALQRVLVGAAPVLGYLGGGVVYEDAAWLTDNDVVGVRASGVDLYDVATGRLQDTHEVAVARDVAMTEGLSESFRATAAAGTPRLAVLSDDDHIEILDLVGGKLELSQRLDPGSQPFDTAIAADGSWTAASTAAGEIVWWDTTGEELRRIDVTDAESLLDVVTPDYGSDVPLADLLASQPAVPTLTAVGNELWMTLGGRVTRFGPDGEAVATATLDVDILGPFPSLSNLFERVDDELLVHGIGVGRIAASDIVDGARLTLASHEGTVGGGNANPRPGAVAAGSVWVGLTDGSVASFDPDTGSRRTRHQLGLPGIQSLVASPDRQRLVVATGEGLVLLSPHGAGPLSAAVQRDPAQTVATLSRGARHLVLSPPAVPGPVDVLAIEGSRRGVLDTEPLDIPTDGAFFADAPLEYPDMLIVMTIEGDTEYDLSSGEPREVRRWERLDGYQIGETSPNRSIVLTGGSAVQVRNHTDGSVLHVVTPPSTVPTNTPVTGLTFHPDGHTALLSWGDGTSLLYNVASEKTSTTTTTTATGGKVSAPDITIGVWSDDGTLLATAASDGQVHVRDASTFEVRRTMLGAVGNTNVVGGGGLLFVDHDRRLLTTLDGVGRLWDVGTGQQIGDEFPTADGTSSGINRGGPGQLVTASGSAALVWNLDVAAWAATACRAAGSNLTASEWAQWGPRDEGHEAICVEHPLPPSS